MAYPIRSQLRPSAMPMQSGRGLNPTPKPSTGGNTGFNPNAGAHTDRKRRFEAREARRDGDWRFLDFPIAMLWFDVYETAEAEELGLLPPPIVDLWP